MDFPAIFQSKTKNAWWMDVIFYFAISLLISTVLCYLIFWAKNNMQREDARKEIVALQTIGTPQQKEYEKAVIGYGQKITDFAGLLKNHEFASNVFLFMQTQAMPNVWFKQFALDAKNNAVQLSGEADNMEDLSRQIAVLEKNEHVETIGNLNTLLGEFARVEFNMSLVLDQSIFDYSSSLPPVLETTTQ